jgi:hypothetical protein
MSRTVQFKRYANTTLDNIVGASGELIVDTTNRTITVHDGSTAGGTRLATEAFAIANGGGSASGVDNVARESAQSAYTQANSASSNTVTLQSNFDAADATINYILGVDAAQNTLISSANTLAQAAFDKANSIIVVSNDTFARNTANNASANTIELQGGLNTANANIAYILSIDLVQNTLIASANSVAQGAFSAANTAASNTVFLQGGLNTANANIAALIAVNSSQNTLITAANTLAQGAYDKANTASSNTVLLQGGLNTANANIAYILGVDIAQNTSIALLQGGLNTANANISLLQGGLNSANANIAYILAVDLSQNTSIALLQGGLNTANANIAYILGVDLTQNTSITNLQGGLNTANANIALLIAVNASQNTLISAANTLAQGAYDKANTVSSNTIVLQGGLNSANANIAYILGVDLTQNTSITNLQGGLNSANANIAYILGVDLTQNTSITNLQGGLNSANANIAYILAVDVGQNTNITGATTLAQAAYDKANTGSTVSGYLANSIIFANTSGYLSNTANIKFFSSNNSLYVANAVITGFGIVFPDGSTQTTSASGASTDATARASAQAAFDKANSANTLAQSAYDRANTGGTGTSSGYLSNAIIFANSAGYLSNSAALQFTAASNTVTSQGPVNITNQTSSTSNATGALIVSGGVGVANNIYTAARVGYSSGGVSVAYTYYNSANNSLDTVFG